MTNERDTEESGKKEGGNNEKPAIVVNITINGGNNQIFPQATKAEQYNYYGEEERSSVASVSEVPDRPWTREDELQLACYIESEENLQSYIASLAACRTARQVAEVVTMMRVREEGIYDGLVQTGDFIRRLKPFLIKLKKGTSEENLRIQICNEWERYLKRQKAPKRY